MKQITKEWIAAAYDDLLSAKTLSKENRLTHVVAFHCQQCIEKALKAVIEEQENLAFKSHDLFRLNDHARIKLTKKETTLLAILNEVYIDSRYPGDMGLMPQGKPTETEAKNFISFAETIFNRVNQTFEMN